MNIARKLRWLFAAALALGGVVVNAAQLQVTVTPRFDGHPLVFDTVTNTTKAGQRVSVTRLDFLLSNFALHQVGGPWLTQSNSFAFINAREGRTSFQLRHIPPGDYDRFRFNVGVPEADNHANPAAFAAGHPLNPNLNGLHWSWQGGYVFLAIEGAWSEPERGFSWHIATDRLLASIELPIALKVDGDANLRLSLKVDQIFSGRHAIRITEDTASTHSRGDDPLALQLRENIERAFAVERIRKALSRPLSPSERERAGVKGRPMVATAILASNATPYRFTFSRFFPQPDLPLDNPLTEEGVALGRGLFHDPRLSINNQQSCASCHQAELAFTDGNKFSLGAEGRPGTRNAMPLFNLAWRNSLFWDGRAPSLREQVLMPIENPIEMHESLSNVVAKLGKQDDAAHFTAAFGSPEITPDRIARALEQFLLTQVSHASKFDRSLTGEAKLTDEEKRGFELFHTEYDPRRGQFGADCFHCHGGPLFQSQSFANNGLDSAFKDLGRYGVTRRDGDRGKFAVPSLRNIARTAPYMHDGRFAALEEVIEHYTSGVQRSATLDPNLAKHPDGGVPLSGEDKRALVAFLRTLTDEPSTDGTPKWVRATPPAQLP